MKEFLKIEDYSKISEVTGPYDRNLKIIEKKMGVDIFLQKEGISIKGPKEKTKRAKDVLQRLLLDKEFRKDFLENFEENLKDEGSPDRIRIPSKRRFVIPKTRGQIAYIEAIKKYDVVFSIGPAGTGKTYLSMAMAVNYLTEARVRRIILTRPAIEAGESLGFLPGGIQEKLTPYLRPLYDALYDMMEAEAIEEHLETGVIEVVPLAYMRGRTLNNSFIILDEAQNCTGEQLKMFLTRLGFDSKIVVTGDITQTDLPGGKPLGLLSTIEILKPIKDIKFVYLTRKDVVRHRLLQKIIRAYEKAKASC